MEEEITPEVKLETRIQGLLNSQQPSGPVSVRWCLNQDEPKIKLINDALKKADEEGRLSLTKELLVFYQEWKNLERIFGVLPKNVGGANMGTIANSGRQFRIWYGLPTHIHRDHADSCGLNLVLSVYGDTRLIEEYIEELLPSKYYVNFYGPYNNIIRFRGG